MSAYTLSTFIEQTIKVVNERVHTFVWCIKPTRDISLGRQKLHQLNLTHKNFQQA